MPSSSLPCYGYSKQVDRPTIAQCLNHRPCSRYLNRQLAEAAAPEAWKKREVPELGLVRTGLRSAVVAFSDAPGPVGVRGRAFSCGGNLRPLLGEENGFLLVTPLWPPDRGVVGNALTAFDDVGVEVLCVVRVFCRTNSQLSGRITRMRTVGSTS